ncbi:MAG: hypothetical protein K2P94_08870 [Rhodospirillaceae bacterium]|nr:hypothetical protein [Rhodospirillaceae bacterium]
MKIGVVSGFYPGRRFNSHVNHAAYCRTHGYYYIDASQPGQDTRRFFRKIEVIDQYLDLFDWLYWIDDDAYFTDFSKPLHSFLDLLNGEQMLICASPSTKKIFTKFSSGQFFLRNGPEAKEFLRAAKKVDLEYVKNQFWREDLGFFSNGDQDAFVYLTEAHPLFRENFIKIIDHNHFNNRDFEFVARPEEHFLVHFTGKTKIQAKHDFCARLGINKYIVPNAVLANMHVIEGDDGA